MAKSIVEYFREHEGYRCGYCGSKDSNYSHGMWAHQMTCQDYQDLIDRGWRRSGKYCYKPDMKKQCCPSYTIRCDALKFRPSKSQKKVMKKMTKYLTVPTQGGSKDDGEKRETKREIEDDVGAFGVSEHPNAAHEKCLGRVKLQGPVDGLSVISAAASTGDRKMVETKESSSESHIPSQKLHVQSASSATSTEQKARRKDPVKGSGPDPNKPLCRKAKELRRERKEQKLAQLAIETRVDGKQLQKPKEPVIKSLEEFLIDRIPGQSPVHHLEIRLVRSDSKEFRDSFKQSFSVYQKYQMAIHKDPPNECEVLQFKRFLVESPLVHSKGLDAPSMGFGSFHQQYYIDGKLIAVGVLDILPKCVSSVYFYYDPEFSFLSLGTYSALRELQFTRLLHQECASLNHYYMGFYIHSCPKMKYKGQYEGSELLCPESLRWCPIKNCRPKLDVSNYSRLDDNLAYAPPEAVASDAYVLFNGQAVPYQAHELGSGAEDEEEVNEYAQLVGPIVAPRMLLFRS